MYYLKSSSLFLSRVSRAKMFDYIISSRHNTCIFGSTTIVSEYYMLNVRFLKSFEVPTYGKLVIFL